MLISASPISTGPISSYPTSAFSAAIALTQPSAAFTRNSVATDYNYLGVLQTVTANQARYGFNPANNNLPLGIIIESQSTNLCLQSGAIGTSPWFTFQATGTANAGTAPDGTTTATQVTTTVSAGGVFQSNIPVTVGTTYTYSLWVKSTGTNSSPRMVMTDGTHFYTFSITPTTSWARYSFSATAVTGATVFQAYFQDTAASGWQPYLLWGAQVEAGSSATSYIPTTSAAVTRFADTGTVIGAQLILPATLALAPAIPVFALTGAERFSNSVALTQGASAFSLSGMAYIASGSITLTQPISVFAFTGAEVITASLMLMQSGNSTISLSGSHNSLTMWQPPFIDNTRRRKEVPTLQELRQVAPSLKQIRQFLPRLGE